MTVPGTAGATEPGTATIWGEGLPTTGRGRERSVAIAAVAEASALCRRVRAAFDPSQAAGKPDRSPVTVADLASQALISLRLEEAFPTDPLMGEEDSGPLVGAADLRAAVLAEVRLARPDLSEADLVRVLDRCSDAGGPGRRWWTLDPVDGTKGFLRDEQYAVALALVEDGEVVLGVLGCPNLPLAGASGPATSVGAEAARGCLFVAERGAGAWQLRLDGPRAVDPSPIRVTDPGALTEACYAESVEAGHSSQGQAAEIARLLGLTRPPVRLDSQAKYGVVARGDASIYLRLPHGGYRENVWDHAAGCLIVREAGGIVTDVEGRTLDFTAGRRLTRNRGVVAAAAPVHDRVLEAVRTVLGA